MKSKFFIVNTIICAVLIAAFIAFNIVLAYSFDLLSMYFGNMGLDLDNPETEAAQAESKAFTEEIVKEGVVLLRNENEALPLKAGNIDLFGWSTVDPVVGGSGGSGGASGANVNIRTSLENAGFKVNEDLYDMYVDYGGSRSGDPTNPNNIYGTYTPNFVIPEPSVSDTSVYTSELLAEAKEFSDVAMVTFGRTSGEGFDLPHKYLEMTQEEKDLAKYLTDNYSKVIVLLNANAPMEIGYLEDIGVDAILFMPGPGKEGISALGKILNGTYVPSGRLVDTFAYEHESLPAYYYANRPGSFVYEDYKDAALGQNHYERRYYVDYVEGIYVGYKYYETAAAEGFIDYDETVQYPFGHGLSYTTFTKEVTDVRGDLRSDEIEVDVKVTNTGDVAGKDVVQIYVTPPYTDGGIEKAYVDLVGFAKTGVIEPDGSATVTVKVDPFEIASYDWDDANGDGETGYILEKGKYELKLMENSHDLIAVAEEYELGSDILITEDPVTGAEINNLFDDASGQDETEPVEYLSRADFKGTYPEAHEVPDVIETDLVGRKQSKAVTDSTDLGWEEEKNVEKITTGADNGLTIDDLDGLTYEDPEYKERMQLLLDQLTIEDMETMICNNNYKFAPIESIGFEGMTTGEGPQGLSAWMSGISGVNFPVAMMVGQTWNTEIAAEEARMFAREARAAGVGAYMAPATNIHRTPYSGRNFEYYSEDGFLAGKMAAAVTYSAREEGIIMYVKHFGLNDQDSYRGERFTSIYTWCNEQAMREIYLKLFEIAVKEGRTLGIMSSFNRIGATWAGASKALLTDLLRTEWGFVGSVITDMYDGNADWMSEEQGLFAGQDTWLSVPFGGSPGLSDEALASPTIQKYMRIACEHIINTLAQATVSPADVPADWFYHVALPIDIVVGVLILGYGVFIVVWTIRKNKKEKAQ